MAQQLSQLIPDFLLMTYEEKLQVIERIRYHKYVSKPSYTKKKTKQTLAKKKTQKKKEDGYRFSGFPSKFLFLKRPNNAERRRNNAGNETQNKKHLSHITYRKHKLWMHPGR